MYFPTIIYTAQLGDSRALNRELVRKIYEERNQDKKGISRSNIPELGGWHSHNYLHNSIDFKSITRRINEICTHIFNNMGYCKSKHLRIGTMWAIVNPPGSSNKAHVHPSSHWSGVYYIQAPERSGDIEFTDPRLAHIMTQPKFEAGKRRSPESWTKVRYTPTEGKMLIFPSWLYHSVDPNLSLEKGERGHRIIISFNLIQGDNSDGQRT